MALPKQDPTIRGYVAIAKALGVASEETVVAYARLQVDPLPLMMVRGQAQINRGVLEQWWARRNGGKMRDGTPLVRLEGELEIAAELGVNERTVSRLAARAWHPLPVYGTRRKRWTYAAAVRDWQSLEVVPFVVADRMRTR